MTRDMIIWIESNSGNSYYINKDFIPIRIKKGETTLDEIKEKAKRYTEKGCKRIFTILHKRYPNEIYAYHAYSISLHLEKFRVYEDISLK
jgi:maltose-binding protein MalE